MKNMYEFYSAIHSVEADEDTRKAVFYLMNTTPNLNRWGVSDNIPGITRIESRELRKTKSSKNNPRTARPRLHQRMEVQVL